MKKILIHEVKASTMRRAYTLIHNFMSIANSMQSEIVYTDCKEVLDDFAEAMVTKLVKEVNEDEVTNDLWQEATEIAERVRERSTDLYRHALSKDVDWLEDAVLDIENDMSILKDLIDRIMNEE